MLRSRLNLGLKVYIVFKTASLPRVPFMVQVHISIHLTWLATEVFKTEHWPFFYSHLTFQFVSGEVKIHIINFPGSLPCGRQHSLPWVHIISFNLLNSPVGSLLLSSLFYGWEDWGLQRFGTCSRPVTELKYKPCSVWLYRTSFSPLDHSSAVQIKDTSSIFSIREDPHTSSVGQSEICLFMGKW